ncbi:uncharacterized protein LOC127832684 [Dreissena polymorpha]|uniref:uncharacterized protein LOC127832684 n=1 Tax=Dreissena polymorpha TaxID=45954 RepID=UPI002264038E|nr:uncharacterized protein LOC127832684 [Dreissena polymorpha]
MAGTWNDVRHRIEQSSSWFLFPNKYEDINEGHYIWTGLSRNTSTSRPFTAPSDCFKLHKQTLEEETDNCNLELPFICQKVPVNCGESFMKTESSLNFTIESGSNDMNCEWKIEGFDNTFIRIEISFVIPACQDCECLKIYDASTTIGPPNKTLCEDGQLTFNSTQQAITLAYSSDISVERTVLQAKWSFVPWPSKSTTSTPLGSTINSRTGSEDMAPNKWSAGLIGGIVAAAVAITVFVIVCIVVIRRRKSRTKRDDANTCAAEMVTSNNETESSGDIYSVSAKVNIRKGMDSVEYGVVNKRQTNSSVSSSRNIPVDSERNSNIAEKTSVDDTGHTYLHHGYNRIEKVLEEATGEDKYNRLNEIMSPNDVNKSDNVYNHVQGIDNGIYDHTADDSEAHDRRASYSHVRGPFPSSENRHDVYDHTTDDFETPDRRDLYSHVRGPK